MTKGNGNGRDTASDLHGMITRTESDLARFYDLCERYKGLSFSREGDNLRECANLLKGILVDGASIMSQLSILRFTVYKFLKNSSDRSMTASWKVYSTELDNLIGGLRSAMFGYHEASKCNRELLFDLWSTEKRESFRDEEG